MSDKSKRKHTRFETEATGKIRRLSGGDWLQAKILNLSKGGACIQTNTTFTKGDIIELHVDSKAAKRTGHTFMSRIVWIAKDEMGIQFITRI